MCFSPNHSIVVHQLASKTKTDQPTADQENARKALDGMQVAHDTTMLKILNAKGKDVTAKHFGSQSATEVPPACSTGSDDGARDDPKQELLGIVRRATDLSLESRNKSVTTNTARPAILLTEDKGTRATAAKDGLSAASPSVIGKYLDKISTRLRSLSQGSQNRTLEADTTTPPATLSPTDTGHPHGVTSDQIMENAP